MSRNRSLSNHGSSAYTNTGTADTELPNNAHVAGLLSDTRLSPGIIDPTLTILGNALVAGMTYFNTTSSKLRIYDGSAWNDATTTVEGVYDVTEFTNIAGQTTIAIVYDIGLAQVLLNGVQLANSDFTATTGTSIVLAVAIANADDTITVIRWGAVTTSTFLGTAATKDTGVTTGDVPLAEDVVLQSAAGTAGTAMLAATTPQAQRDLIGAGRKNLIINGGFDVWQRGVSFANPGTGEYLSDRYFSGSSRTSTTVTKNTGVSVNSKLVNTIRFDSTSADTWDFYQAIEDYNTISEQTVTISFWYKTNLWGIVCRHYSTATYGSPLNSDGAWRKFEVTATLPTLVGAGSGANKTSFGWWATGTAPSAGSFLEVAMFQIELGSVATDFEHRSYGEELALCQRYYYRLNVVADMALMIGTSVSTTLGYYTLNLPQPLSGSPSVSQSGFTNYRQRGGGVNVSAGTVVNSSIYTQGNSILEVTLGTSGLPNTIQTMIYSSTGSTGYIEVDAEL